MKLSQWEDETEREKISSKYKIQGVFKYPADLFGRFNWIDGTVRIKLMNTQGQCV